MGCVVYFPHFPFPPFVGRQCFGFLCPLWGGKKEDWGGSVGAGEGKRKRRSQLVHEASKPGGGGRLDPTRRLSTPPTTAKKEARDSTILDTGILPLPTKDKLKVYFCSA